MRPGCVQLSVSALLSGQEATALSASFERLVQRLGACGLGSVRTSILAQLDGQAVLLDASKRQVASLDLGASRAAAPAIASVRPLAMTPAYSGPILVTGRNLAGADDALFCRNGGVRALHCCWLAALLRRRGALAVWAQLAGRVCGV